MTACSLSQLFCQAFFYNDRNQRRSKRAAHRRVVSIRRDQISSRAHQGRGALALQRHNRFAAGQRQADGVAPGGDVRRMKQSAAPPVERGQGG